MINEDRDSSLISDELSPIFYGPKMTILPFFHKETIGISIGENYRGYSDSESHDGPKTEVLNASDIANRAMAYHKRWRVLANEDPIERFQTMDMCNIGYISHKFYSDKINRSQYSDIVMTQYRPYGLNIAKSSLPKLIYSDFELKNKSIECKGGIFFETGTTVWSGSLRRVGGDIQVLGVFTGTHNVRTLERITSEKSGTYNVKILGRITSEIRCSLSLIILCHMIVHNLNEDIKYQVITFVLKGDRNILESKNVEYSFEKNGQRASATVKPIVNPIELKSKSLRDKLEYLKSEHVVELYDENRDYTEQFAYLLIEHKNALGDGTFKKHIKSERVGVRKGFIKDENRTSDRNFDSRIIFEPIVTKPIVNPIDYPVTDSSTGGGVVKVKSQDLYLLFDDSVSKIKPKRVSKTKNMVPTVNSRPRRNAKPPDRLNIASTGTRSYAHVVAGLS